MLQPKYQLPVLCSYVIVTNYEFCFNREFLCRQFQCFFSNLHWYTIQFKHDNTWFYYSSPKFQVTFTFTHPYLLRLAGNWFIRENAYPNITFTFHVTGHCLACSLNLTVSNPLRLQSFQTKRTKGN